MPTDIFDQLASEAPAAPPGGGDIFDQIAGEQAVPDNSAKAAASTDINAAGAGRFRSAPLNSYKPLPSLLAPPPRPLSDAEQQFNQGGPPRSKFAPSAAIPNPQTVGQAAINARMQGRPGALQPDDPYRISEPSQPPNEITQPGSGQAPALARYGAMAQDYQQALRTGDTSARQKGAALADYGNRLGLTTQQKQEAVQANTAFDPVRGAGQFVAGTQQFVHGAEIGESPSQSIARGRPMSEGNRVNTMAAGGTEALGGLMEAGTGAFGEAVAKAPIQTGLYYLAGVGLGKGAKEAAAAAGASPEVQEAANTLFFFAGASVGTLMGIRTGEMSGNGSRVRGFSAFGDRVGGAVATTPEQVGAQVRVGPFTAGVTKPRGGGVNFTAGGSERLPDPGQVMASDTMNAATTALAKSQAMDVAAKNMAAGIPPPAPPKPPEPGEPGSGKPPLPQGMAQGHLTQEVLETMAQAISIAPPENRGKLVMLAHENLATWVLQQGRIIGPDGQIQIAKNPDQAQAIAQKIINTEVARQDEVRNKAEADQQKQAEQQQKDAAKAAADTQKQQAKQEADQQANGAPTLQDRVQTVIDSDRTLSPTEMAHKVETQLQVHYLDAVRMVAAARQQERIANAATVGGKGHEVVPESPATIDGQMEALKAGTRNAVHVPTDESGKAPYVPKLPQGFSQIVVKPSLPGGGIWFYNSDALTPGVIKKAAANRTHGDLTGNVATKESLEGKPAVVVQAQAPDGTPLQDSAVDGSNLDEIARQAAIHQEQFPGSQSVVKHIPDVFDQRMAEQTPAPPEGYTEKEPEGDVFDQLAKEQEPQFDESKQPWQMTREDLDYKGKPRVDSLAGKNSQRVNDELSNRVEKGAVFTWHDENGPRRAIVTATKDYPDGRSFDVELGANDYALPGTSGGHGRVIRRLTLPDMARHGFDLSTLKPAKAKEKPETKYEYGNTQAAIPKGTDAHTAILTAQDKIADSDLAGKGRDVDEPHVTVRYGIQGDDTAGIKAFIESQAPFEAKLGKTDIFPPTKNSDGAAVVMAPVESPELHRLNAEIEKHGDFKESDFPDYKPHATIAYVSPGSAKKYKGMAETEGKAFRVESIDISKRDGSKETIQLKGAPQSGRVAAMTPPEGAGDKGTQPKQETPEGATYYHGTNDAAAIRKGGFALSPETSEGSSMLGDNYADGIYLAKSKAPFEESGNMEGLAADVLPTRIAPNLKIKQVDGFQGLINLNKHYGIGRLDESGPQKLTEALKKDGYDGIDSGHEVVIFDPKNVSLSEPNSSPAKGEEPKEVVKPGGVKEVAAPAPEQPTEGAVKAAPAGKPTFAVTDRITFKDAKGEEQTGKVMAITDNGSLAVKVDGKGGRTNVAPSRAKLAGETATEATKATEAPAAHPFLEIRGTQSTGFSVYNKKSGFKVHNAGSSRAAAESYIAERMPKETAKPAEPSSVEKPQVEPAAKPVEAETAKRPEAKPDVSAEKKVAERFHVLADGLDKQIEEKQRTSTQNPTPKRNAEAASRRHDARNLQRTQRALRALADAHEAGTVPPSLAKLRTKDEIGKLVRKSLSSEGGYYSRIESNDYADKTPQGKALQELMEGKPSAEKTAAQLEEAKVNQIRQLESEVQFAKIPGSFPTPKPLAAKLVSEADIQPGMTVLEPSAGKGNIAEAIRSAVPEAKIETVERQTKLQQILELKGFKVAGSDFLEHEGKYDRIVMNPPFENGQDGEHIMRAFGMLKSGGKLVAISSEHPFFANDAKAKAFRDWLESVGGTSEKLPVDSFKSSERPTGVATRLIEVSKPAEVAPEVQTGDPHLLSDDALASEMAEIRAYTSPLYKSLEKIGDRAFQGKMAKYTPEAQAIDDKIAPFAKRMEYLEIEKKDRERNAQNEKMYEEKAKRVAAAPVKERRNGWEIVDDRGEYILRDPYTKEEVYGGKLTRVRQVADESAPVQEAKPAAAEQQTVTTRHRVPDAELNTRQLVERLKAEYPGETGQTLYGKFVQARNLKPEIDAKEFGKYLDGVSANAHVETKTSDFNATHTANSTGQRAQLTPTGKGYHALVYENGSTGTVPDAAVDQMYTPLDAQESPEESFDPAQAIKIAADDITKLRNSDVFRVLDTTPSEHRWTTAQYIKAHRVDLRAEVDKSLADIKDDEPAAAAQPDPKPGDTVTVRLGGRDWPNTQVQYVKNGKYGVDVMGFKYVDRADIVDVKPKAASVKGQEGLTEDQKARLNRDLEAVHERGAKADSALFAEGVKAEEKRLPTDASDYGKVLNGLAHVLEAKDVAPREEFEKQAKEWGVSPLYIELSNLFHSPLSSYQPTVTPEQIGKDLEFYLPKESDKVDKTNWGFRSAFEMGRPVESMRKALGPDGSFGREIERAEKTADAMHRKAEIVKALIGPTEKTAIAFKASKDSYHDAAFQREMAEAAIKAAEEKESAGKAAEGRMPITRAEQLKPLAELRLKPKDAWHKARGVWVKGKRWVTDGYMAINLGAENGKSGIKTAQKIRPNESAVKEFDIGKATPDLKYDAEFVGYRPDDKGEHDLAYFALDNDVVVGVNAHKMRLAQDILGADIKFKAQDAQSALAILKKGKVVGLLMPMRIAGDEINVEAARKAFTGEKPVEAAKPAAPVPPKQEQAAVAPGTTTVTGHERRVAELESLKKGLDRVRSSNPGTKKQRQIEDQIRTLQAHIDTDKAHVAAIAKREALPLTTPEEKVITDRDENKWGYQKEYFLKALEPAKDAWLSKYGPESKFGWTWDELVKPKKTGVDFNRTVAETRPEAFPDDFIRIEVPGDGKFLIKNTPAAIDRILKSAPRAFAKPTGTPEPQLPRVPKAPKEFEQEKHIANLNRQLEEHETDLRKATKLDETSGQSDYHRQQIDAIKSELRDYRIAAKDGETKYLSGGIGAVFSKEALAGVIDKAPAPVKELIDRAATEYSNIRASRDLQEGLYDLDSQANADVIRAKNIMEKAPGTAADSEVVYHHIEDPTIPLNATQQALLDEYVKPLMADTAAKVERLNEGGVTTDTYVHRIVKDRGGFIDRLMAGSKSTGRGNVLKTTVPSQKSRTMMAIESPTGDRQVVSIKGDRVTAFADGKSTDLGGLSSGLTTKLDQISSRMEPIANRIIAAQQEIAAVPGEDRQNHLDQLQKQIDRMKRDRDLIGTVKGRVPGQQSVHGVEVSFGKRAALSTKIEQLEKQLEAFKSGKANVTLSMRAKGRINRLNANLDKLKEERGKILDTVPTEQLNDEVWKDKAGKQWKITQATTKEIEGATNLEYYHNALGSAVINWIAVNKQARALDFLENFTQNPEFHQIGVKVEPGKLGPDGWKPTSLPQLRSYYFEPHTAEVLDWYHDRLKAGDPGVFAKINSFLVSSIFFNPLLHTPNIVNHWVVEKGVSGWADPTIKKQQAKAMMKAINAVMHQNDDFLAALDAGGPLQSQQFETRQYADTFLKKMQDEIETNPKPYERIAKALGYLNPLKLLEGMKAVSSRVTWYSNDIAFLQATYEKTARGMDLKTALRETAKHIPDYRMPTRILNSLPLQQFLSNKNVVMFMNYHYGALKSYGETVKSVAGVGWKAEGENAKGEPINAAGRTEDQEKGHALDILAALGLMTFIAYPLIDKALRKATGNPDAQMRRAGASTVPFNLLQVARGEKSPGDALQSMVTPGVAVKTGVEMAFNRDLRTGRQIYSWPPQAAWPEAQQIGGRLAQSFGPTAAVGTAQRGGWGKTAWSMGGVSFPQHGAMKIASEISATKAGTEAMTPDERKQMKFRYDAIDALRAGDQDKAWAPMDQAELSSIQRGNVMRAGNESPLEAKIKNFNADELQKVYNHATAEEKLIVGPLLEEKREMEAAKAEADAAQAESQ